MPKPEVGWSSCGSGNNGGTTKTSSLRKSVLLLMGICLEAAKVVGPISISLKVDRFRDERISRNSVKSLAELLTVNQ